MGPRGRHRKATDFESSVPWLDYSRDQEGLKGSEMKNAPPVCLDVPEGYPKQEFH